MGTILKAKNISKQYRLGTVGTGTLRDDFTRFWAKTRGREDPFLKVGAVNDRSQKSTEDYVWALRDIDFEVQQGEVLGIIGKNGAGKSTLLKILSMVTAPTTGIIKSRGRIASLLEVGTGFNHELTGRENIYLNGAILGMSRAEITSKINEIVDFSGCGRYIDTPTKRYSSGMTLRLAFAVAAHLEPEILVVDEVLAVGDAEFQKKAIGKMQDISQGQGRTVLFVSHNMASVQNLCERIMVLENGSIKTITNDVDEGIGIYLEDQKKRVDLTRSLRNRQDRTGLGNIRIVGYSIKNDRGRNLEHIISGSSVRFIFECKLINGKLSSPSFAFTISRKNGGLLAVFSSELKNLNFFGHKKDFYSFTCGIESFPFAEDNYVCNVTLRQNGMIEDWVKEAFEFTVINGDFFGSGKTVPKTHGGVLVNQDWEIS